MNDTKFKIGDIINLINIYADRDMIITAVDYDNQTVECAWHDDYGRPQRDTYPMAIIELSDNSDDYDGL